MSWFGSGGDSGDDDNDDDYDDDYNDTNDDNDTEGGKVIADFDPSALERGAKALHDIDNSSNAREVLRLAMVQERTKEAEARKREQELVQQNLMHREQLMRQEHDMRSKQRDAEHEKWQDKMQQEARQKQQLEQQSIEQKRQAQKDWLERQRELNEENLNRQRQIEKEIEEERRRTLDYQAKLDQDTAKIRAKAETEGKISQERKNEDVHLRSQKERITEERTTKLEIRKEELAAYRDFFASFHDMITDKDKVALLGKAVVGVTFGVYGARQIVHITGRYVENHLGKPALVRETSRWSWRDMLPSRRWFQRRRGNLDGSDELKGVILEKGLQNKMKFITRSTRNTKRHKAPFRHLCIYGPPGTGKTLFARTLSRQSGLDYAVLTGGDFSQLGANAVTELHKVFDWAEASRRGTILFIDEADAFLRKGREGDKMSEHMRNALSAFLYRTGTETKNFMVCLATNVPSALDKAVMDRIDDVVEFPLPGVDERQKMLTHYFNQYITQTDPDTGERIVDRKSMASPIKVVGFDEDSTIWDRLTEKTDGFSGRQIAKFMIQVQATMYGSSDDIELTPFLMEQVLETYLKSKNFDEGY